MLEHLGWNEAKNLILHGLTKAILSGKVTYDFERLMDNATLLSCSEFGRNCEKYVNSTIISIQMSEKQKVYVLILLFVMGSRFLIVN